MEGLRMLGWIEMRLVGKNFGRWTEQIGIGGGREQRLKALLNVGAIVSCNVPIHMIRGNRDLKEWKRIYT
jgi:hypothetical protein